MNVKESSKREMATSSRSASRTEFGLQIVIVLTIALAAGAVAAQDAGVWVDGERACIPLERYEPATPLPRGCPALIPGVLLTIDEEHRRAVRTNELAAENAELRRQLDAERRRCADARIRCALLLEDAGRQLQAAGHLVEDLDAPSPWPDRLVGASAGALAVGLVWLFVEIAP